MTKRDAASLVQEPMHSKLFSQYPQMAALVWGTTPVRMHEKYEVPVRVPLQREHDSQPPRTERHGLFQQP